MIALTRFALGQARLTLALTLAMIVAGVLAWVTHPSQEDPEITIRTAVVTAQFPGLSAGRVEALIVRPIEQAARQVAGVTTIDSAAQTGFATVKVELGAAITETAPVWSKLRDRMDDLAPRLPAGTVGPAVNDDYGRVAVATLALHGEDFTDAELGAVARAIRDRLATTALIGRVDLFGVQDERIWIEIDRARLDRAGVTVDRMVAAIADQNLILSAGAIETPEGLRYALAPDGAFTDWRQIGAVPVPTPDGGQVQVRDLATLLRGYTDPVRQPAFFDGRPAVVLGVSMAPGAAIQTFDAGLQARLAEIRAELPVGLSLDMATHQASIVAASVSEAAENLGQTIATVLAVVVLFLGLRAGLIVGALAPLAICLTLVGMALWGVPLHRISIAAIIIALGLLVDNGVVIVEDMKRRIDGGATPRDAALSACGTLAVPLLTSSLTTIVAFLPLMLAEDATGEFLRALSQVLTLTLLASWLLSLTVIPLLAVRFLGAPREAKAAEPGRLAEAYAAALGQALDRPRMVLAAAGLAMAGAIWALAGVPSGLLPPSERAQFVLNLQLEAGTSENATAQAARRLARHLADRDANPEITGSVVYVGAGGPRFFLALSPLDPAPHVGFAVVNLRDAAEVAAVRARVEAWMADALPEARGWTERLALGETPPGTVELRLVGEDADALFRTGRAVEGAFTGIEGVRQVRGDWANPVLQLDVLIDPARARRADVAPSDVARSLAAKFDGAHVTDYREGDRVIPVMLRARPEDRTGLDALADSAAPTGAGGAAPLLQVAELGGTLQPWVIRRRDHERALTVSAVHPDLSAADLLAAVEPSLAALPLPDGLRFEVDGELRAKAEANAALGAAMPACLLAIALILLWQFNSFRRAGLILGTIPLVIIGVAAGMRLMGGTMDFNAMLGVLSLAGIVINNGIVLIERIDAERVVGLAVRPALLAACAARARPIVMTTLTTIVGLMPLHLFGGELWRGMTIVMMFGLGVGTMLTLFVAPAAYSLLFRENAAGRA